MLLGVDARLPPAGDEQPPTLASAVPAARSATPARVSVFLFCDLRGYTDYTRRLGAEAGARLVERLAALAEQVATSYRGRSRGVWGDQVLLEFLSARDGVRAAVALREACLVETLRDVEHPLWAGIGLDAGEAAGADVLASAPALNVASRLCARASAGEALATREVVHLAGAVEGVRYLQRRAVELKGIPGGTAVVVLEPTESDQDLQAQLRALREPAAHRATRRAPMLVALAAAIALSSGLGWLNLRGNEPPPQVPANGVAVLDRDGRVSEVTRVGGSPAGIVAGPEAIWVVQTQADAVARIDPGSRTVVQTIPTGKSPGAVAARGDDVWVTNGDEATVSWVNAATNRVVDTIRVGSVPAGIAYGAGRVWVSNSADDTVSVIAAATGGVQRTVPVGGGPAGVAFGAGRVWVANSRDNTVTSIDPRTFAVGTIPVGSGPRAVAVSGRDVWVANSLDQTVTRIDPSAARGPTAVAVGDGAQSIVAAGGVVWVGNAADGTVSRIDPASMRTTTTVALGASPTGLASSGGSLWSATRPFAAGAHRGGTLTDADSVAFPIGIDPALAGFSTPNIQLVHDTLVSIRRAGGPALDLVPDLARQLPGTSDGGRTWTVVVRHGIRYSDGRTVKPSDFRRGLERYYIVSRPDGPGPDFDDITGARTCRHTRAVCRLDEGISTTADTVTFHLTRADAEFPSKLTNPAATPVPPGTPMSPPVEASDASPVLTRGPVLGTGPYRVARFRLTKPISATGPDGQLTLTRNPYFHRWSNAATPDGYPDVIRWTSSGLPHEARRLDQVTADVTNIGGSPLLTVLKNRAPSRLHHELVNGTVYLTLNTRAWPFRRQEARTAIAYALDRAAVATWFGTTRTACQIPPPNFPGHQDRCLYQRDPSTTDDTWRQPDLVKARRIVHGSPTRGATVRVYLTADADSRRLGGNLTRMLTAIGYHPTVRYRPASNYFGELLDKRTPVDLGVTAWGIDYLAASQFYNPILDCASATSAPAWNLSHRCNPALDALMRRATAAQVTQPAKARRLWTELYQKANDDAAIIPAGYWDNNVLTSERVGNYQSNSVSGPLLEQMWVK
jgi:YVTN family beta-propeller protein